MYSQSQAESLLWRIFGCLWLSLVVLGKKCEGVTNYSVTPIPPLGPSLLNPGQNDRFEQ